MVADHLARGPVAFAEHSRLTAAEIEARTGPNTEARWELRTCDADFANKGAVFHVTFPSGIDDIITFEMHQENGAWRVDSIHCLAERGGRAIPPVPAAAAILMVVVVSSTRRRWPYVAAAGVVVLIVAAYFMLRSGAPAPSPAIQSAAGGGGAPPDFAALVPLRRAIAAGDPLPQIGQFTEQTKEISLLWKAQHDMGRAAPEEIERQMYAIDSPAPLATVVRARTLASEGRHDDAMQQYAALRNITPKHDAFWWEEEMAAPREASLQSLRRAIQMQTRDPEAYYLVTIDHLLQDQVSEAITVFHEAFSLRPVSRATVVSSGILALLPRDMSSKSLIDTSAPDEPVMHDASLSQDAIRVPAAAKSLAAGGYVRIAIGGGTLEIPMGASIAPAGTEAVTGEEMDRVEADDAVQRAAKLTESSIGSGEVQHTIENAVDALSAHNRWGDIIRLTDGITAQSENVSPDLLVARVRALVRMKRFADARNLALSLAAQHVIERKQSAYIVAELAELLAQAGAYNEALEMYRKVKDIKNAPDMTARVTQVALRRTLDMSTETAHTTHFEIHSMPEVAPQIPAQYGQLLETDLQALMARFNLRQFRTLRVNILRWDDFRWQVTGSDYVVGFYDGDLTIPWGTLGFGLAAQSVMTHELTHAVVAQASNDTAPRWFQEGIAQRMERVEKQENIFDPAKKRPLVALSLLDAMLQGSADIANISSAYVESLTVMHFLEEKYGPRAINKMIAAYKAGATNEDAIRSVTGKQIADVDREFRVWGATHYHPFPGAAP